MIAPGIKRGTAELAVLSVLEDRPLHGYEMARRIEQQTQGALRFTLASLYPLLYRLGNQRHGPQPAMLPPHSSGKEKAVANPQGMGRALPRLAAAH
jgi:hypothetical protein